jgi:hypothetical protein
MKKLAWLALVPLAAIAGIRDDYAQQWPLTLSRDDGGAYRVVLNRDVYRQLRSPALEDLDVVSADGVVLASSLFGPEQPLAQAPDAVEVPWFPLPRGSDGQPRNIASLSEIASDGSLRRVVMADAEATGESDEYLIDVSRLREPVSALRFEWKAEQPSFEHAYQVAASDDLKSWRTVQTDGRLIQLENVQLEHASQRISENRIELDSVEAKYLRVLPLERDRRGLQLTRVLAELPERVAAPEWQWEELSARRVQEAGVEYYQFEVRGRFPFQVADVLLPGNSATEWVLKSRDDPETEWQFAAAPWMTYQVEGGGAANRSAPQRLDRTSRHRYWRLLSKQPLQGRLPTLRLGYRPEVVVFLAQGQPPYALLAGSARAQRAEAPLPQLVEALRRERGGDWQPSPAYLGQVQALAGEAALKPAPPKRDWKSWLLWALLVGGALLVAGFAFSLLRNKPAANP